MPPSRDFRIGSISGPSYLSPAPSTIHFAAEQARSNDFISEMWGKTNSANLKSPTAKRGAFTGAFFFWSPMLDAATEIRFERDGLFAAVVHESKAPDLSKAS